MIFVIVSEYHSGRLLRRKLFSCYFYYITSLKFFAIGVDKDSLCIIFAEGLQMVL
jgi:hypothetical protein